MRCIPTLYSNWILRKKIVKKYLEMDDILENKKALDEAVLIAKSLIDVSLENMKID